MLRYRRRRIAGRTLGWVVFLGLLAACEPASQLPGEVRIGVIAPLSGPLHDSYGDKIQKTARFAAQQVNAAGGLEVGGRHYTVTLLFEDSADNPHVALGAARKLVNQDEVVALVGPILSHNALAVSTLAERQHIPMITPGASDPILTAGKRYVFRVGVTDDFQGRVLARFAREDLGAQRAAVLYDVASIYNRSMAEVFREVFEAEGGTVTAFESYTTGETDFQTYLARIQAAQPEVLFLPNYSEEVQVQARLAREMGIAATLLGGDAWEGEIMVQEEAFERSYFVDHWHQDASNVAAKAFIQRHRDAYGYPPSSGEALVYDAFGLLFSAMEGQDSFDAPQLQAALATTENYQGVSGTISYRESGDPVRGMVVLVIEQGEVRLYHQITP